MKNAFLGICVFVLTACASSGSNTAPPTFEGESHADATLKRDALANAQMLTSINGCSNIQSISTSVISQPSGEPGKERVEERWILEGCGRTYPFLVTFTGDGEGGTFVNVGREF